MFIPLHDRNGLEHIRLQYVTITLIVINVLAWLVTGPLAGEEIAARAATGLGFIPAVVFDFATLDPSLVIVPPDATLVTYAFLHTDIIHLGSNMLFLWVFGDNVEDALGPRLAIQREVLSGGANLERGGDELALDFEDLRHRVGGEHCHQRRAEDDQSFLPSR